MSASKFPIILILVFFREVGCRVIAVRFVLHRWHVSGSHLREGNLSFQFLVERRERKE